MMISDVWNLGDHLLTEFDLRDLLIFIVNKSDKFVGVDPHREIINVKASGVLLEMDLIVAFAQVAHDVAESISVVEESRVDKLEFLSSGVLVPLNLEKLDKGLLVAGTSMWEHPFVVKFGTDIGMKRASVSLAWR